MDQKRSRPYGIKTEYRWLNFRSRLEATWARFFDLVGWKWKYEPFDYAGYIPDFALLFDEGHILAEVKPCLSLEELKTQSDKLTKCPWDKESLVLGAGLMQVNGDLCLGVLYTPDGDEDENGKLMGRFADEAMLVKCRDHYGFSAWGGGWHCRVKSHPYDEKAKYVWDGQTAEAEEDFSQKWALAQNLVQWSPKMFGVNEASDVSAR